MYVSYSEEMADVMCTNTLAEISSVPLPSLFLPSLLLLVSLLYCISVTLFMWVVSSPSTSHGASWFPVCLSSLFSNLTLILTVHKALELYSFLSLGCTQLVLEHVLNGP